jgi:GNAT superfamily N-acetyltransferase
MGGCESATKKITRTIMRNAANENTTQTLAVRPLTAADAPAYRRLRQHILDIGDGRYFSDSYAREAALDEKGWRAWCTETRSHAIIGLFDIMMITQQGGHDSPVVEWEATWVDPRYRSTGIAKAGYAAVEQWTKQNGFTHAVVFIRADNVKSREIRERTGFVPIYTIHNETWADGSTGDTVAYVRDLRSHHPLNPYVRAAAHLEEVMTYLQNGLHAPDEAARPAPFRRPRALEAT